MSMLNASFFYEIYQFFRYDRNAVKVLNATEVFQYLINVGEIGSKRSYSLNHLLVARNLRHYTCIWCCTDTVYTVVYICFD